MEQKEKDNRRFFTPSGAGIAFICFFLPWFKACGSYLSGIDLASKGMGEFWIALIAAIAIIILFFYFESINKLSKAKVFTALASIISILIILVRAIDTTSSKNSFGMVELQAGLVGTIIGFIISLIGVAFLIDYSPDEIKLKISDRNIKTIFCPKCGKKYDSGIPGEYCEECGTSLTAESEYEPEPDDSIPRINLFINKERNIKCPDCNRPLHLDDNDIKSKYFKCPNCKSETYFKPILNN